MAIVGTASTPRSPRLCLSEMPRPLTHAAHHALKGSWVTSWSAFSCSVGSCAALRALTAGLPSRVSSWTATGKAAALAAALASRSLAPSPLSQSLTSRASGQSSFGAASSHSIS